MTVKLRFAPSPTGFLHIGNARTALVNWLFARAHQGTFYLRFDDTDLERSKEEYKVAAQEDLAWLGWTYEHTFCQMARLEAYKKATDQLIQAGRLYPCYETPEELEFKRRLLRTQGRPPIYDRAALKLTEAEKKAFEQEGRRPHWRFLLKPETVSWPDLAHGALNVEVTSTSDPILIRENGTPVYILCSVVDDLDYDITHILRGNDHISNTAVQIQLIEALGQDPSKLQFAHLPLLAGEGGEKLSKRLDSLSLRSLREDGIEPMAINSHLAKLGTSEELTPALSLEELIQEFDLKKYGKSAPCFSMTDLLHLNGKLLHKMPYNQIAPRLEAAGFKGVSEDFWRMASPNLEKLGDLKDIWEVCYGTLTPQIQEPAYLTEAMRLLPAEPWDEGTWDQWTSALKGSTGRKGKELFMPLRLALTAQDHGPEMKKLLRFIGREKALKRLQGHPA